MTPHIVIDGEVVSEKVAEHPAFRNVARSYAKLFDMQHDKQYQEALTYTSPTTGELVNASFLVPRTVEDLQRGAGRSRPGRRRPTDSWGARGLHELRPHGSGDGREVVFPGGPQVRGKHPQLLRVGPRKRLLATHTLIRRRSTAPSPARSSWAANLPPASWRSARTALSSAAPACWPRSRRLQTNCSSFRPPCCAAPGGCALFLRLCHSQRRAGTAVPVPHLALQRGQHARRAAGLPLRGNGRGGRLR